MTEDPVFKILWSKSLPMLAGIMGIFVFNLVDTFFIGQLGTRELAAVSFTFPVIMLVGGVSMGLGTGASAVISKAVGQKDFQLVQRLTTDSLVLSFLVVVAFVLVGIFSIDSLFLALGASEDILPLIKQYMLIWYPGMAFLVVPMVGNSAIRATGDMKTPGMVMLLAMLINLILDPLLIFGIGVFPRMELAGAATATIIARATTFFVSLWVLYFREKMITIRFHDFSQVLDSWKKILYIGLPSGATNLIIPVGAGAVTRLISFYGAPAVAAFGVASRIEMFVSVVFMALASVLGPFVGQNWGAGRLDRIHQSVDHAYRFALIWGVLMMALLAGISGFIAPLFSDNPEVIKITIRYLWIVPVGYGFQGILMMSSVTLNVLNRPFWASSLSLTYVALFYVPLAYLGSSLFLLDGIFGAAAIAKILTGILAGVILKKILSII